MSKRWGADALESIPLKLMIVAVVATMSILPAAQALAGLESREFVRRAQMQLERIMTAAQILTVQGPGNVRTLGLDFTSGSGLKFEELTVGDRPGGPNSSSAVLRLNNGAVMTRLASAPECAIRSKSLTPFVAVEPAFDVRLTSVMDNRTIVVVLEMV